MACGVCREREGKQRWPPEVDELALENRKADPTGHMANRPCGDEWKVKAWLPGCLIQLSRLYVRVTERVG